MPLKVIEKFVILIYYAPPGGIFVMTSARPVSDRFTVMTTLSSKPAAVRSPLLHKRSQIDKVRLSF
jgi:hypothetical protein